MAVITSSLFVDGLKRIAKKHRRRVIISAKVVNQPSLAPESSCFLLLLSAAMNGNSCVTAF
jgi:hypothetical protein